MEQNNPKTSLIRSCLKHVTEGIWKALITGLVLVALSGCTNKQPLSKTARQFDYPFRGQGPLIVDVDTTHSVANGWYESYNYIIFYNRLRSINGNHTSYYDW